MVKRLRRWRPPAALELALVVYWAFAVLHVYYAACPVDLGALRRIATPAAPPTAYARAHVRERLDRLVRGHAGAAVFAVAATGLGLGVAPWLRLPGPAGGERLLLSFGLGLGAAALAMFGIGLAGVWYPALGLALAAGGVLLAIRRRRRAGFARGLSWPGPVRWLLAGWSGVLALNLVAVPAGWGAAALAASLPAEALGGALRWRIAVPGAAVLATWVWLAARAVLRDAPREPGESGPARFALRVFAVALAVGWLALAAVAETPERFYDAQVYHLAGPALFTMHHRIPALPNLLHTSLPLGVQMLYGWQWLLGGEPVVRAWRVLLVPLLAWAVFRLAARDRSPATGVIAAALVATCPIVLLNAMQTSPDIEVLLLAVLAVTAALAARREASWLPVAGTLAGASFAGKPTVVFILPWLALYAARFRPGAAWRAPARRVAVWGAVATVWLLPTFARNTLTVANPAYPYATQLFPAGRQWDPARLARFREQSMEWVVERKRDLWKLPWLLSKSATSETYIGPALLLLGPVALLHPPAGAVARATAVVGGLGVGGWMVTSHIHRFGLSSWMLLFLPLAAAIWGLRAARPRLGEGCLLLLAVTAAANTASSAALGRSFFDPVDWLAGRESRATFLGRKMIDSYAPIALAAGPALGRHGRVMMLGETRGLYWPAPFITHSVYDRQVLEEIATASFTPDRVAVRVRQHGATHVFVSDRESSRLKHRFKYPILTWTPREKHLLEGFWDRWMDTALDDGQFARLYALRTNPRDKPGGVVRPLSLDENALRIEFEGFVSITWMGDAKIQTTKHTVLPQ